MNSINIIIFLFMCYIHINSSSNVNNTIISAESIRVKPNISMAHVIFRHGDRNPIKVCPNDVWKDPKYWPEGIGQLTNIGKLQVFELGEWLANRYQPLFPNGYSAETAKVYTCNLDRTMMSAAACLAGLFPPTEQQIWKPNLNWQPIPINVLDSAVDTKIRNQFNKCKLRDQLYEEYMSSEEVQKFLVRYQNTTNYVKNHCGETFKIFHVHDPLNIEMLKNKTIPVWASEDVIDVLRKLRVFKQRSYTATPQMARLKIGFLIKEIIDNFNKKKDGNEKGTFVLYSGQDKTIASILNAFGLYDDLIPYAACLMFELYQEDDEFYVQIVYKKEDQFRVLDIPDCGTKCPLGQIIEKYQNILPQSDYDTECKNKE